MKKNVVVGMSGGVDSSVTASILLSLGYNVTGVTLKLWEHDGAYLNSIIDAQTVCNFLSIRHTVIDLTSEFKEYIIDNFCATYLKAQTPNPCVFCNEFIKFGFLLKKAISFGGDFLATGHYASVEKDKNKEIFFLKKAKDLKKDQSYFLYRLKQSQLKHILFPLSNFTKQQVREIALKEKIPVAQKADSQEICFIPDNDYRKFLRTRSIEAQNSKFGPIVNMDGKVIGQHKGVSFYTIGQREGLGIALGHPAYIVNIDSGNNTIRVGKKEDVYKKEFIVGNLNFINKLIKKKSYFNVKIRYNQNESKALVVLEKQGKLKIKFEQPQFAITPGQSAVIYDKDNVIGGGIIEKVEG